MTGRKLYVYTRFSLHRLFVYISCLIILFVYILNLPDTLCAQDADKIHPQVTITAVRINPEAPRIDGILDDEVWEHAPVSDSFIQKEPNEGQSPTERTTVQIVYDDEALYVGVMCYDSEPDRIVAQLTRRDGWIESDSVNLLLDPYHDHQTGNQFMVNAAGMKRDSQICNDGWHDSSWDGIWEAETAIGDQGWGVEYRIPYHTLRFNSEEEYVWGMCIGRHISRRNEDDHWSLIRKGVNGLVSQFGHIEGIRGIHPPRHLEIMPFAVGRSTFSPENSENPDGRGIFSSAGLDMRYGVSSNISLNATVNPDFGQVEADPASLNLTAFETFYPERRPFFIAGNSLFGAPGSMLFYSRRIGRQPGRFPIPEDSKLVDKPDSTTILSAAKLTGKTANKTSFGILDAVTTREYATIENTYTDPVTGLEQTRREKHLIEPFTSYLVGRIQQDVMKNSNVGAMLTAVNREDDVPAYAAEVDGNLKWKDGKYSLSTRLAGSHAGPADDRKSGYEAVAHFHRSAKWMGGGLNLDARSPGFDVNDLGFMDRSGKINSFSFIYMDIEKQWLFVRKMGFWTCNWTNWNYDGIDLGKGGNFYNWIETKNRWFMDWCITRGFESLNDTGTRGGPLMLQPASISYFASLGTDDSKPVSFGFHTSGGRSDKGLSSNNDLHVNMGVRPASYIQLDIGASYGSGDDYAQWVENAEDAEGNHYVFGELDRQTFSLPIRLNVSFTPELSFQLYMQPFVAVGNYSNFKELVRPRTYEFRPYDRLDFNPDFHTRSLRGNAVLRWEYMPGSVLFLVWSQSRSASLEATDPALNVYENLRESITDEGENILLIKANYWLGL